MVAGDVACLGDSCGVAAGLHRIRSRLRAHQRSGGGSFRWLRDAIGEAEKTAAHSMGIDPYELLTQHAAGVPVGSEGLLFLPYLTGERTPYPDPQARGAWVGLTLRHGKAHLVRSVLEGVSFGLRDSLELIKGLGVPIAQVRASGEARAARCGGKFKRMFSAPNWRWSM